MNGVAVLCAMAIRLGLDAGIPLTPYYHTAQTGTSYYSAATRRYTFGPAIEWRFANGFGLEADALFKRTGYVAVTRNSNLDSKGDSWDVPVVLKYRTRRGPYLAAGPVFRYIGPIRARGVVNGTPVETADLPEIRRRVYEGATVAAGIELGAGRVRFLPEVRYARWLSNIHVPGNGLRIAPNQAELLLGVRF